MNNHEWDISFLQIAKQISKYSKDPSTQCGAIIVKNKIIISSGYNGLPRHIEDRTERYENRDEKYKLIVHAEENAIFNAVRNSINILNTSIYVYGLPVCSNCAKSIIQSGITSVYYPFFKDVKEKWKESEKLTIQLFNEADINLNIIETTI